MKLLFSNNKSIELEINQDEIGSIYQKIYKNLSHVPIPFLNWDNPYYFKNIKHEDLVDQLIVYANRLSVNVDKDLCLQKSQQYFNSLHEIYEKNYNGNHTWLDFHEHIHLCEPDPRPHNFLSIDYREKAGLLEKNFNTKWMKNSTTKIKKGDIFIEWAELGKIPYTYWRTNEPNDIDRMCELAKPWLKLRPRIIIATEDIDFLENKQVDEFNTWWDKYQSPWCEHWGINKWTIEDMFSVIVFGQVTDIDTVINYLENNILPIKVSL